jgi:hypothetical protein
MPYTLADLPDDESSVPPLRAHPSRWAAPDDDELDEEERDEDGAEEDGAEEDEPEDDGLDEDGEDADLDDDELEDELEADFPLGDGTADMSADVWCPYCGESSEIGLDPGSGSTQRYVEDCPVCCRPWTLTVQYDETGAASVVADADDAMDDDA